MVVENALEGELNDHLGYSRNDPAGRNGGNSRNGYRARTVQTEAGRLTKRHPSSTAALPATRCGPPDHRSGTAAGPCPGGCDAAVGDVDRAVASGGEAGSEEQLADTQVRTVAVPADPDHVACRVRGRALVQPAGLEFGGVEHPVLAEAAALHGGQAPGPDVRRMPGDNPPDACVSGRVQAAEQFRDVQRTVRAARRTSAPHRSGRLPGPGRRRGLSPRRSA